MQDPDSVYSFYKRLIRLRKEKNVIAGGTIEFFEKENPDVLAYRRNLDGEEVIVLNNLTGESVTIQAKPEWKKYRKLLGNYAKVNWNEKDGGSEIVLQPYELLVLER